MIWTRENLDRITTTLKDAGKESWPRLCKELNIRSGTPNTVIVDAIYGSNTTADHYEFEPRPWHDKTRNVVVVENPWSIAYSVMRQMEDPDYPVLGSHIELDDEIAMKILVLGMP